MQQSMLSHPSNQRKRGTTVGSRHIAVKLEVTCPACGVSVETTNGVYKTVFDGDFLRLEWITDFEALRHKCNQQQLPLSIVQSDHYEAEDDVEEGFGEHDILEESAALIKPWAQTDEAKKIVADREQREGEGCGCEG